jgi:hypothetical protein
MSINFSLYLTGWVNIMTIILLDVMKDLSTFQMQLTVSQIYVKNSYEFVSGTNVQTFVVWNLNRNKALSWRHPQRWYDDAHWKCLPTALVLKFIFCQNAWTFSKFSFLCKLKIQQFFSNIYLTSLDLLACHWAATSHCYMIFTLCEIYFTCKLPTLLKVLGHNEHHSKLVMLV